MALAKSKASQSASQSSWARLVIGGQVLGVVLLATAVVALLIWISRRPPLHQRFDLTADNRGSLAEEVAELCEQLEDPVRVEIFFSPVAKHLQTSAGRAQQEMIRYLFLARSQYPTKFEIIDHDMTDVARVRTRLRELSLREENIVVLSRGRQKAVLRLMRDIAEIEFRASAPGQAAQARLAAFKGEEAFGAALRKVLQDDLPQIYFTTGHGERSMDSSAEGDLLQLVELLRGDGFEVKAWLPPIDAGANASGAAGQSANSSNTTVKSLAVPADCDLLAIVGPTQPFSESTTGAVQDYVNGGGNLLAAMAPEINTSSFLGSSLKGSLAELLGSYGVEVGSGLVCRPTADRFGQAVFEGDACLDIRAELDSNHPISRPLWKLNQTARFIGARPLKRAAAGLPLGGVQHGLARSGPHAWVEPDPVRRLDAGDERGSFQLALVQEFPVGEAGPNVGERVNARFFVSGTADLFASAPALFATNQAFLLNVFNWLAARDRLMTVSRQQLDSPRLSVTEGSQMAILQGVSTFGLPALCFLLGALLWWRRRS